MPRLHIDSSGTTINFWPICQFISVHRHGLAIIPIHQCPLSRLGDHTYLSGFTISACHHTDSSGSTIKAWPLYPLIRLHHQGLVIILIYQCPPSWPGHDTYSSWPRSMPSHHTDSSRSTIKTWPSYRFISVHQSA